MHALLGYITWDVSPTVFSNLAFPRWYGLLWALGIIAAYMVFAHIYKQEGHNTRQLDKLAWYVLLGALVGARLGHILFYEPVYYWQHPIEILPIKLEPHFQFTGLAGLASHGGVIGILVALYWYCRKYGENYWWILDRLVIVAALVGACIRFGNLMNSEMIGIPATVPWAFIFAKVDAVPRHPVQLYEALYCLGLFFFLFNRWMKKRDQWKEKSQLGLFLLILFSLRFLDEFLKVDQVAFESQLPLNMGQLLSIPFVIMGLILWWKKDWAMPK